MSATILNISEDYWNIRGSFRIGGVVDIGTHASLVRLANGRFLWLDAYTLDDAAQQAVDAITGGREQVQAILNLHPFHTVHCEQVQARYPQATLYGTARHQQRLPELPWAELTTDDPRLHELFADDLEFSVPAGVEFISRNENIHFSSVLALHRRSRTIHVDDTYMYVRLPAPFRWLGDGELLRFHPTLAQVLERRPGAVAEFRGWAEQLARQWGDAENLCAAHTATLTGVGGQGEPLGARMEKALKKVERTLRAHERRYG